MGLPFPRQLVSVLSVIVWCVAATVSHANALADRNKIETFLEVTGFDVALESIRLSASSAPLMLGFEEDAFGSEWTRLTNDIFDTNKMHDLAVEMLEQTLTEDLLAHADAFYNSDLGKRLVEAENASHMVEDDDAKSEAGDAIFSGLVRIGSNRVETFKRMTQASDSSNTAVRAIQEIQVRFLMAASGAGVVDMQMEESDLRALLAAQEGELRVSIQSSALSGAAYTYQAFSDKEVEAYARALEQPQMRKVYDLMNAVQYQVMADRFEALGFAMSRLQPSTDL